MKKTVNVAVVINREAETITVSKDFLRRANVVGSPEYTKLLTAQKDYPHFTLETRKVKVANTKKPHIEYKAMEEFISEMPDAETNLALYERVKAISKIQRSPYNYVRDWFLSKYYKQDAKGFYNLNDETLLTDKTAPIVVDASAHISAIVNGAQKKAA